MRKMADSVSWAPVDSFAGNTTSPNLTSRRACPICGSRRQKTVAVIDDLQFFSDSAEVPKRCDLIEVQCLECFALFLNPCYSDRGFKFLFSEAGHSYGSAEVRPAQQIDWMKSRGLLNAGASVLDVGCYEGGFLSKLPSATKKIGVDIDAPAIERGRKAHAALGIEFVHGDFETFRLDRSVDTITMFHVLEHLARPIEVLKRLRALATDRTRLVVEVPTLENGLTNDINGFFSFQHMTHFSHRSLHNCLARAGWNIVEVCDASDYNGCRVLAEPHREQSATEGDPKDFHSLETFLAVWHKSIADVEKIIAGVPLTGRLLIWGGGMHTELIYQFTSLFRASGRQYVVVDNDPLKQGKTWRGIPIHPPAILDGNRFPDAPILVSSYGGQEAIAKAAAGFGIAESRLIKLYDRFRSY